MLVLSRREGEKIIIGDSITITVVRMSGDKVRVGVEAPDDVLILRSELEAHHNNRCVMVDDAINTQKISKPAA
jgi:Carbon storage regulator (could also regulate swarming and quorum sensing)